MERVASLGGVKRLGVVFSKENALFIAPNMYLFIVSKCDGLNYTPNLFTLGELSSSAVYFGFHIRK